MFYVSILLALGYLGIYHGVYNERPKPSPKDDKGVKAPPDKVLPGVIRIACVGDSITAGLVGYIDGGS